SSKPSCLAIRWRLALQFLPPDPPHCVRGESFTRKPFHCCFQSPPSTKLRGAGGEKARRRLFQHPSPIAKLPLLFLLACGGARSHGLTIADDARRKPDGVAIDPASAPPAPRDRAKADERLVTLRTPLGIDLAIATVTELFQRVVHE